MSIAKNNCSVINLATKGKFPHLPFALMKEAVLGKKYQLSAVFAPRSVLRRLNRAYRGKNKATDILSFPLSGAAGEIFINPEEAKKESKKFGRNYENFIGFLFIHGLAHLKGLPHGSKMEALEEKSRGKFNV